MSANEPRKITVQRENPIWQEYDREVCVELWNNPNQTTVFRLSREEAWSLRDELGEFLCLPLTTKEDA